MNIGMLVTFSNDKYINKKKPKIGVVVSFKDNLKRVTKVRWLDTSNAFYYNTWQLREIQP